MYDSVPSPRSCLPPSSVAPRVWVVESVSLHLLFALLPFSLFIPWAVCSVIHSFIHLLTHYVQIFMLFVVLGTWGGQW